MSDQKNTPGADSPLPEKAENPGAFPDLTAHSDAPAWLSTDGSHDTAVWERSFDGGPDAGGADAGTTDAAEASAVSAAAAAAGAGAVAGAGVAHTDPPADEAADAGTGVEEEGSAAEEPQTAAAAGNDLQLPAEPAVVAPDGVELEEPSLAEPAVDGEGTAEPADPDAAPSAADPEAAATAADPEPARAEGDIQLPPEPVVVAPEELELEEPALAEPTLGSDAVDAAELDDVTSEAAAVEANAAEAGRLSGLEPAPAGAEIKVEAKAAGIAEEAGSAAADADAGESAAADADAGESAAADADAGESAAADADAGEAVAAEATTGETAVVEPADSDADAAAQAATADGGTPLDEAAGPAAEAPQEQESADSAETGQAAKTTEHAGADTNDAPAVPAAGDDAAEADGDTASADVVHPAAKAEDGPDATPSSSSHPLAGIDAAAPVTGALPGQERTPDAPAEPEPTTASVPTGETRRSRRLAESQAAAGATAARRTSGKDTATPGGPVEGTDTADVAAMPESGSAPAKPAGGRNTRLLLVIGGVVLAAVAAILLVVFVFNGKDEGVISESVSPVELETGACLKGWEDVNSAADVVTCDTPHDAQLVASERFTGTDTFPGTAALEERVNEVCNAVDYADNASSYPGLKVAKSIPTEQTWSDGDRRLDCFVFSPEGQEITESLIRE